MLSSRQEYLRTLIFLNNYKRILYSKKIIICSDGCFNFNANLTLGFIKVFFQKEKILIYKKFDSGTKAVGKTFGSILQTQFVSLRKNIFKLSFINLNKNLNFKLGSFYLKKFKKFKYSLFLKREFLYLDFINLITLFTSGFIGVKPLLYMLSKIFVVLLKNRHSIFLMFIKMFLKELTKISSGVLLGLKFYLKGRFKGKPRKSHVKVLSGVIPCQSAAASVDFSKIHIYNKYGAYGFKLWANVNKNKL